MRGNSRIANRSAPPGPVVPYLVYPNVEEAARWLCETFGFAERFRYGAPNDPAGALLSVGEGSIFLIQPHAGYQPPTPGAVTQYIGVRVADVDSHYEHAKRCQVSVEDGPESYPFGERQYSVADPGGIAGCLPCPLPLPRRKSGAEGLQTSDQQEAQEGFLE